MYEGIDKALADGCRLHGFLSGGGLRVIRLERYLQLKGYGEHPYVTEALLNAEMDYEGSRKDLPHPVVGETYLTGSSTPEGPLDAWILQGRKIDAVRTPGGVRVELTGVEDEIVPERIHRLVLRERKETVWMNRRGFRIHSSPSSFATGEPAMLSKVISKPRWRPHDYEAWHYDVLKRGEAPTFSEAVECALAAPAFETYEGSIMYTIGDPVLTVKPEEEPTGYASDARASNLWGVYGTVVKISDSHGLCYQVKHPDETLGWYEPGELQPGGNLWMQLRES